MALTVLLLVLQLPVAAAGVVAASWLLAAARARHLPPAPFHLSLRERLLRLGLCWLQPLVRETARLLGMLELGAAPGRGPCWTTSPAEPRKWALPLGELSFWSESGPAREAFLREFEAFVRSHHGAVRGDDGWQGFDLELRPEADLSPAIVTVEEYHGDNRCLLRVRRLLRVPPQLAIGLGIALALLLWQALAGSELARIGLAALGLSTAAVLLITRGLLLAASQRAALRSMEHGARS